MSGAQDPEAGRKTRRAKPRLVPWLLVRVIPALVVASVAVAGYRIYRQIHQDQLDQAMIQAIVDGKEPRALALLDEGADVNAVQHPARRTRSLADLIALLRGSRGGDGPSALALAVRGGREKVSLRLLERGAKDVHAGAPDRPLLVWAVHSLQPAIAISLLKHGANEVNVPDNFGDQAHSLVCRALRQKEEPLALELLDRGGRWLPTEEMDDFPLVHAAKSGLVRAANRLMDAGAPPDGLGPGLQPITAAAMAGNLDMVKLLIQRGAHVNPPGDSSGWDTPLMLAAGGGKMEVMRYLVGHGAKVDYGGRFGTAITHAAEAKQWAIVRYLAEHGASIDACNYHGTTPFDYACRAGNVGMAAYLLRHGASVKREEHNGWAPIFTACENGSVPIVRMILDRGVDINHVGDSDHRTPLMTAAENGHLEAVRYLLSRGADPNIRLAGPYYGNPSIPAATALGLARKNKHPDVVKELLRAGAKQ